MLWEIETDLGSRRASGRAARGQRQMPYDVPRSSESATRARRGLQDVAVGAVQGLVHVAQLTVLRVQTLVRRPAQEDPPAWRLRSTVDLWRVPWRLPTPCALWPGGTRRHTRRTRRTRRTRGAASGGPRRPRCRARGRRAPPGLRAPSSTRTCIPKDLGKLRRDSGVHLGCFSYRPEIARCADFLNRGIHSHDTYSLTLPVPAEHCGG